MEFPKEPTKRQLERQQAIATVISGMAYRQEPVQLERTDEAQRGFNYATYVEYVAEPPIDDTPLDGQTYQPAPCVVPDTQTGYDLDGNFHCVPTEPVPPRQNIYDDMGNYFDGGLAL